MVKNSAAFISRTQYYMAAYAMKRIMNDNDIAAWFKNYDYLLIMYAPHAHASDIMDINYVDLLIRLNMYI